MIEDRIKYLVDNIDRYIEAKNFGIPTTTDEIKDLSNITYEEISGLVQDDCFNYAYMLYQYAESVCYEKSKQLAVSTLTENSLNSMLTQETDILKHRLGDVDWKYVKHDIKIVELCKISDLANKLYEWKVAADSRVSFLSSQEYNIRKKADCLMEKGKRK